jgi:methylated-DNA-[protein]-cysteine S-methyltransferase
MSNETIVRYAEMESPIGPLVLAATEAGLCNVEFGRFPEREPALRRWSRRWLGTDVWSADPGLPVLAEARRQLEEYFRGVRKSFDIKLEIRGTDFQTKVWQALREIPYGERASYKDIAVRIGSPKAVRAVGGANNRNPLPIVIPCHRVVGADGALVGYGGGLPIKTFLLQLEGEKHEVRQHRSG